MPKFCPCADCCNGVMLRQPTGDMTDMYVIELHNRHLMEKRKAESARAYLDVVNAPPEGALQQGTSTEAAPETPQEQAPLLTAEEMHDCDQFQRSKAVRDEKIRFKQYVQQAGGAEALKQQLIDRVRSANPEDFNDIVMAFVKDTADAIRDTKADAGKASEGWGTPIPEHRAPTGSQDAPSGQIYLYTYQKWNQDLLDALSKGPLLETCRHELELGGHSCVLPDSGASVFVRLDQWQAVMEKIAGIVLKKHHVIVADEFDHLLHSTVNQIRSKLRPRVKTRTALEIACPEAHYHMEVAEAPWGTPNPTPIPTPAPTPSSSPNRELPPSQGPRRSRGLTAQEQQIHFAGALAAYEKAAYEKTYDKTYAGAYAKASAQAYAKACGRLRSPTFAYAKACGRKTQS